MDEEIKAEATEEKTSTEKKKENIGLRWLAVLTAGLVFGAIIAIVFLALTTNKKNKKNLMNSDVVSELDADSNTGKDKADNAPEENISKTMNVSSSDVSEIADNVLPAVVSIECISEITTSGYGDIFGFGYSPSYRTQAKSTGSGFIIGQNGDELLIATNNHVVDGADSVTVEFIDGKTADAKVKGTDSTYDVAVISVDMDDLSEETINKIRIATIGSSDDVKVGDMSIAIGNALGYGQSVTVGYISALNRDVKTQDGRTMKLMQTDTIINHGNSGGPLLNIYGEVIGITSSKYGTSSTYSYKAEAMCFAIPISEVIPIINELMNRVELSPSEIGYLGIEGKEVSDSYAKAFSMPKGLYVYSVVKDSAADKSGIKAGDVITAIDGRAISTMEELKNILSYKKYDTEIEVTYSTLGNAGYKENTITVKLGKKSSFDKSGSN